MQPVPHSTTSTASEPVCRGQSWPRGQTRRHGGNLPLSRFIVLDSHSNEAQRRPDSLGGFRQFASPLRGCTATTRRIHCPSLGRRGTLALRAAQHDDWNHKRSAGREHPSPKKQGSKLLGYHKGICVHREGREEDNRGEHEEENVHGAPSIPQSQ